MYKKLHSTQYYIQMVLIDCSTKVIPLRTDAEDRARCVHKDRSGIAFGMGKIAILVILIAVAIGAAVFVFSPSVNHYQVTVDVEGDGSVTGTGTYAEGTEVTLVAVDGTEGFFK